MSWQDKERERYEKKLAERWTREGRTKDIKAYEITSGTRMTEDEFLSQWKTRQLRSWQSAGECKQ